MSIQTTYIKHKQQGYRTWLARNKDMRSRDHKFKIQTPYDIHWLTEDNRRDLRELFTNEFVKTRTGLDEILNFHNRYDDLWKAYVKNLRVLREQERKFEIENTQRYFKSSFHSNPRRSHAKANHRSRHERKSYRHQPR